MLLSKRILKKLKKNQFWHLLGRFGLKIALKMAKN
tara:strand:- start:301 stop:405 length:105 start_codon:yes stop_codon:yes gene_type:complete